MVDNSLESLDSNQSDDDTTGNNYNSTISAPIYISNYKLYYSLSMWIFGLIWFFVDIIIDINLVARYYSENKISEMWCTLGFILVPSAINSLLSLRMIEQDKIRKDKSQEPSSKVSRRRLRYIMLALLMSTPYHIGKTIKYALRYRNVRGSGKQKLEERYYGVLMEHDSDSVMLKIIDSFLEAAPQLVLQISVLMRGYENLLVHQSPMIASSVVFMALCLVSYQSSIRNADENAVKMSITGRALHFLCHCSLTVSRVISLAAVAYLSPRWTVFACALHTIFMALWLRFLDRSEFCKFNIFAEWGYAFVLGAVYVFTYILSVRGNTRCRYIVYYAICVSENVACAMLWYIYADKGKRSSIYFDLIFYLSIVPYFVGLMFMVIYYSCFHHKASFRYILCWKHDQGTAEETS